MNNNHQSLIAAMSAFQSSLEKMNMSITSSFNASILATQSQALLDFRYSLTEVATISSQISLAAQMQAQRDVLISPIRQMQEIWIKQKSFPSG